MFRCMGCMEEYDEEYELCPHCGYVRGTQSNEVYHLQPGSILRDRYIVGKVIGFGGFGVTYIGWDNLLEKKVAVKEYFPSEFATRVPGHTELTIFSGDREEQFASGCEKFEDEAKRLVKFNEVPGIVSVFDTFMENQTAYIIMEYLEGKTLKRRIEEEGKLSVDETLEILIPVLEALCAVHAEGIIHRDIAPDNIFLCDDGAVKLIDFGASRFATTKHSKSLSVMLKPGYSPVEQYRSRGDQGPWTDVYSVAATFYKAITGVTPVDSMERNAKDTLKEPSKLGVKVDKSIENSIMNAMNIDVEGRTQSAEAFLEDLRAEEVKRIRIKKKKVDIGKWPIWAKISSSAACVAILGFGILLATGIIHFDMSQLLPNVIPEGKARVPNLLNMSVEEAQLACEDNELILQVTSKNYSDVIPAGQIMAQSNIGGSLMELVNEDGTVGAIGVTVSAGVEEHEVPDLFGYDEGKISEILDPLGFTYSSSEVTHLVAPGAVASQNIERETAAESGTELQLTKSTGMSYVQSEETTVPDVVGKDEYEAAAILGDSGLYFLKTKMEYNADVPKYAVISQETEPGTACMKDGVVSVVVSLGGELTVPDVQYKEEKEATGILENVGLVVHVEYEDSDVVAKGKVIRQSLEVGTTAKTGSDITIYISKGRDDVVEFKDEDIVVTDEIQQEYDNMQKDNIITIGSPTAKTTITVPSLVGKTEQEATNELSQLGLKASVSYKHDESKEDKNVMTQSLPAGTEVKSGTSVLLVVCNNEKKTQYAYRTVTEETTESSSNTMEGWTLSDTTMVWSDYGAWSAWQEGDVTGTESRQVESRTEYKYSDYQTTEETNQSPSGSKSGWNHVRTEKIYGAWKSKSDSGVGKSSAPVTATATLEIKDVNYTITNYVYYHWFNYYDGKWNVDSVSSGERVRYGNNYTPNCHHLYMNQTPLTDQYTSFADRGGNSGSAYYHKGCPDWGSCFNVWWLDTGNSTYSWSWKQRSVDYKHYYDRWTDWSDWSTNPVESSRTRKTQTRTQYRYRDRTPIYTYHFTRTIYGDFSEWSDTEPQNKDGIEVTTREVYVY